MIISEYVIIKCSGYVNKRYSELGYDVSGEFIKVKVSDLSPSSHVLINVKCDYCDNEREVTIKYYNTRLKTGNGYACSPKCSSLKASETNIIRYGVTNAMQSKDIVNKVKKTMLDRYGVDHPSKVESIKKIKKEKYEINKKEISKKISDSWKLKTDDEKSIINDKRSLSNMEKYGVKSVSQLDEIKNKVKETVNERYDGYTLNSDILMEKVNNTLLEKYGTININSLKEIRDKIKETSLEKYGYENPSMSIDVKNKIRNTINERYGTDNIMHSDEFRKNNYIICSDVNYIKYMGNGISLYNCDRGLDHTFEIHTDNYTKRRYRNTTICTTCFPINSLSSIKEKDLLNFIKENYSGNIIENYRDGIEIDIYLPELKIGFEFNGVYWHSDKRVDRNKHIDKLNHFKERGIRIIYIWEDDWDNKKDIICSQLLYWLNSMKNRIYARNCVIKEVGSKEYKEFITNNHIQGYIRAIIKIGLYYNDELISIMTFDNIEGRNKMLDNEWNLSRFCNKINYIVNGSASKLLSYFIKNYNPNRVISYADKEWSTGSLYKELGFNLKSESDISYKYVLKGIRYNKQRFKKSNLVKMGYDSNKSESEIMNELGYSRVYDCGQMKFEKIIK